MDNPFEIINIKLDRLQHSIDILLSSPGSPTAKPSESRLIDRKQLAALLGLHEATIVRYAKKGLIKEIRVGGAVRFRYEDVLACLQKKCKSNE